MYKTLIIIKREFLHRIKKKSFLVTTILVPILLGIGMVFLVKMTLDSQQKIHIAVFDESGEFSDKLKDNQGLYFKNFNTQEITKDSLKKTYIQWGYEGILCIPKAEQDRKPNITYFSEFPLGLKAQTFLNQELTAAYRSVLLVQEGHDYEFIKKLDRKIEVSLIIKDQESEGLAAVASALGYIIGFIMYFFLAIYGTIVMRGVMEEKTNRIVEVMVSLVKPIQLMMGKIVGIGLVGFAQFIIWFALLWLISLGIGFFFNDNIQSIDSANNSQDMVSQILHSIKEINFLRVTLSLLFYFFFGYVFYASQYAAIGAASTEDTDLQTLAIPVTFPIIISFVLMLTVIDEPYSKMAVVLSYIPFSSPIIMMTRIPFDISVVQQLISMAILFASSLIMVWLSARVYKTGILIQGKKVTLKEIITWFFYKN